MILSRRIGLFVAVAAVVSVSCDDGTTATGSAGGSSSSTGPDSASGSASATVTPTGNSTNPTDPTNATVTTSPTDPTDSGSTTTTTTEGPTTEGDETTEGSTSESEGSSSTGGAGVIPCQPEMSRAVIDDFLAMHDSVMPNLGSLSVATTAFGTSAGTGFTQGGAPQGGGGDTESGGFITDPDGGLVSIECSVWEQDCDKGEKCAAWANDGGNAWNATRCVPVDAFPQEVGDPCTVEGTGVSGIDSCEFGAMCWDVDPETNQGTCVAQCEGSPEKPTCGPEGTACSITNEGVVIVCLPVCNPLADECPDGQGCYPVGEFFQCAPAAGGASPGEACEFVNACTDGSGCVAGDLVPGCSADSPCCSSFCEIGDDSACLDGQVCVPWYEMGAAPDMCLEETGVCISSQ